MEKRRFKIDLFAIGLFFVPFDNLSIAPSSGWATISPFVFFLYVFLNLPILGKALVKAKWVLFYFTFGMWIQLMLLLFNELHIASFIDGLATTVLGISFFLALIIRYQLGGADKNKDGALLLKAYTLSFIYGIIRLLVMKYLNPAMAVFYLLEKRPYTRIAFSFTEPSFVSMHIIGVLWLFIYLITDRILIKKMLVLGLGFAAVEFLFLGSTRCVMDFGMFFAIYLVKALTVEAKHLIRNTVLISGSIMAFFIALMKIPRLNSILRSGIYSDASGASRWFRMNAAVKGFVSEPIRTIFGYGMGNLIIPLRNGYNEARLSYRNGFVNEVVSLGRAKEIDSLFCFPVKLISDWGLIITLILIVMLVYKALHKHIDMCVVIMTMWLYVQFDSYAFYSLWLLLYIVCFYKRDAFGTSYYSWISYALRGKIRTAAIKKKGKKPAHRLLRIKPNIFNNRIKHTDEDERKRLYTEFLGIGPENALLRRKAPEDEEYYRIEPEGILIKRKTPEDKSYYRIEQDENLIRRKVPEDEGYYRLEPDEILIRRKAPEDEGYYRLDSDESFIRRKTPDNEECCRIRLDKPSD